MAYKLFLIYKVLYNVYCDVIINDNKTYYVRFKYKNIKFFNLYSFVSDLSQWGDYKYYEYRKKECIKKTGKISSKENKLLLDFKNIHEKSNKHIEIFFIFSNIISNIVCVTSVFSIIFLK